MNKTVRKNSNSFYFFTNPFTFASSYGIALNQSSSIYVLPSLCAFIRYILCSIHFSPSFSYYKVGKYLIYVICGFKFRDRIVVKSSPPM